MNLTDFLTEHGVPFRTEGHPHCRSGWCQVDCVQCSPGWQHWRLGIYLAKPHAHCWSCGNLNLGRTLAELTGQTVGYCLKALNVFDSVGQEKGKARGKLKVPEGVGPLLPIHERYLKSRGFDPEELVKVWGIKGIGLAPSLAWRLWIPIVHKGEVISWTTRGVTDNEPRYVNAKPYQEKMGAKETLYGGFLPTHSILVGEGPTDVWRVGRGCVATLGTAHSQAQVRLIAGFPKRIICFDNEKAAQDRARKLCSILEAFPGQTIRIELDSKDLGSAKPKEIRTLRRMLK